MFGCLISILFLWASRLSVHGHQTVQPFFFFLLFIYFVNHSILSLFFIRFLLRSVAVRRVRSSKIKWYYLATKYTSKIVTNIFAHEINVIKRRGQIKKELFFVGGVWENICVNTDITVLNDNSYGVGVIDLGQSLAFKKWYRCSEATMGDIIYLSTNHWDTELQCTVLTVSRSLTTTTFRPQQLKAFSTKDKPFKKANQGKGPQL